MRGDSEGRLLVCVCMRKMSFNGPLFATIRTFQDVGVKVALRQPSELGQYFWPSNWVNEGMFVEKTNQNTFCKQSI